MNLLGMILLKEKKMYDAEGIVNELKNKWNLVVSDVEPEEGDPLFFNLEGYDVAVAYMPAKIPENEVESMAEFNYFWKNGVEESSTHTAHIIITILNCDDNAVKENLLFTMLASSVLNNSDSLGIYIGNRTLVLKKEFYQDQAEIINNEELILPIYNWIYFGIRAKNGKYSVYTYGLYEFGKKEMEIIDSEKSLEDISEMMYIFVSYVLANNIELKDGETIGLSEEQKLKITESDGVYLDGKTLKIEY